MQSSSDPNGAAVPPPNNPVLSAYEGFVRDTPLVSRYIMTSLLVTWLISFFIDISFAASVIPYFAVHRFEAYRILLSPIICSNLFSLIFAYFSFVDHGKRLEFSMGSAQFGWLFFSLGTITNVSHIILTYSLYLITNDRSWIFVPASGIWTVLFSLIAIECVRAPAGSVRKLFIITVPTLQYPVLLCCLFSLLSGIQMAYFMALGIGYAYGYGYLEKTKVSDEQARRWEDSVLANFATREGWVVGHAATGSDAWSDMGSGGSSSGSGTGFGSLFTSAAAGRGDASGHTAGGGAALGSDSAESFPSSAGRPLGGPTRRPAGTAEAREARLKALEATSKKGKNEEV